jgi:hypothetical protein
MGLYKRRDSDNWYMSYVVDGLQYCVSTRTRDRAEAERVYASHTPTRKHSRNNHAGGVYFVRSGELVKIGCARNVQRRINELQCASPEELILIASFDTGNRYIAETIAHKRFAEYHVRGEWFRLTDEQVLEFVNAP